VKFYKESPARLASTLNIQTALAGLVSRFCCIVEPYSLQMMSRDDPPREDVFQKTEVVSSECPFRFTSSTCLLPQRPLTFRWAVRGHRNSGNYTECSLTIVQTKTDSIDLHCLLLFCSSARLYAVWPVRARPRPSVRPSVYLFSYPGHYRNVEYSVLLRVRRIECQSAQQCLFVCLFVRNTATCFGSLIYRLQADRIYRHEKCHIRNTLYNGVCKDSLTSITILYFVLTDFVWAAIDQPV
jgi:hypothetical protein